MPVKKFLIPACSLLLIAASAPCSRLILRAEEASTSAVTLQRIPKELQEIFLQSLSHPDNPLPYSMDSQGVLYKTDISTPAPLTEPQVKNLIYKLKGIWLASKGLPPALSRKGESVPPHLYDPDGQVSMLGNEVYERLSRNQELLSFIALEDLSSQIQKYIEIRMLESDVEIKQSHPLDVFFDQARLLKDENFLAAEPADFVSVELSKTLPFRLQNLKKKSQTPLARSAADHILGGSGIPAIPPNVDALFQEARRLDDPEAGPNHEKALEMALSALPMGGDLLKMGVHKVWAEGYTGRGVKVAMIEANGFPDTTHPVLKRVSSRHLPRQPQNIDTHATYVAGILQSAAPGAEILAYSLKLREEIRETLENVQLKTKDQTMTDLVQFSITRNWTASILEDAYQKGAKIISISNVIRAAENPLKDPIYRKIEELAHKGILVVAGVANHNPQEPYNAEAARIGSSYSSAPSVLTVGNIDADSRIHPSSNSADIYAPGTWIYTTVPTIPEFHDRLAKGLRPPFEYARYKPTLGTSMSAPFLAGIAACLTQAAPQATPDQMKQTLLSTAIRKNKTFDHVFVNPVNQEPIEIHEELHWKIVQPLPALKTLQKKPEPSKNP